MRSFSVLSATLFFVVATLAITVTSPVEGAFWDASKSSQSVSWTSVSSDPNSFDISLVNMVRFYLFLPCQHSCSRFIRSFYAAAFICSRQVVFPNINIVLQQGVSTSSGSATVNAPSSGWPTGQGFQINLLQTNPTGVGILAQSKQFNITGIPSSSSSSVSSLSRSST
jgi:hypothetical protein